MNAQKIRSSITCAAWVVSMMAMPLVIAAPTFPAGKYKAGEVSIQFDGRGHVKVSQGDRALVDGEYTTNADQLKLTDKSGPMACPKDEQTGTYRWKYEDGMLTLSMVEDRCDGRTGDLTGRPWKKEQ